MQILVLTKPVPDPAAGAERLTGPDFRLDRAASPTVVNGNDEYALEAALQARRGARRGGGDLAMAPANATETMRKALAMGAQRGILVTDPALAGADLPATVRVIAAAPRPRSRSTSCSPASTPRTGRAARSPRGSRRGSGCRCCRPRPIEPDPAAGRVRVKRLSAKGYDLIEAPMPAVVVVHPGAGRAALPSLKGIMAARSREIAVRGAGRSRRRPTARCSADGWATRVVAADPPPPRGEDAW